jgi:hypothetical protein
VGAALQRNEKLPLLLARPPSRSAAAQNNQDDVDRVSPPQGRLHPHLLVAALPAQFMTPHFVLMGSLLTALQGDSESDAVLPAAKRSAPSTME